MCLSLLAMVIDADEMVMLPSEEMRLLLSILLELFEGKICIRLGAISGSFSSSITVGGCSDNS